ncbi:MAG: beta-class carbonic anhydrase [Saezia sp.]
MSVLDEIVAYNNEFVASKEYEQYLTDKYPNKNLAILSCMDARMVELLLQALGLKNGDAKMIKNAGALVTHPFGSVMRSLLIAVYELNVEEILVIGHFDCGMQALNVDEMLNKAKAAGITQESIELLSNAGIDLHSWLKGFECVEDSIMHSVGMIKKHPLMPSTIKVHGLAMNPTTGRVFVVHQDD